MTHSSPMFNRASAKRRTSFSNTRTFDVRALSLKAASHALKLRRRLGYTFSEAICPFEIAEKLGIDVRLENTPSLEGMYCRLRGRAPLIVLAAERPLGRQHFNCAHELGHHEFGHGTRVDELLGETPLMHSRDVARAVSDDPDEFLSDRFAAFLLMPKAAIDSGLALRGFDPQNGDVTQIYAMVSWLGVGYRTLVEHLHFSLHGITPERAQALRNVRLPVLRAELAGHKVKNIVIADEHWVGRPIDLRIGELLLTPATWQSSGGCLTPQGATLLGTCRDGTLWRAIRQGQGVFRDEAAKSEYRVRVSPEGFIGRAVFRHLDDDGDW